MDLVEASENFRNTIQDCRNLQAMHQKSGGATVGRRSVETSANGAIIVLALGAWQTAVENMTKTLLVLAEPDQQSPLKHATYRLIRGNVIAAVNKFSTPNAQNSRALLQMVGFDPRPWWVWSTSGGPGQPARQVTPQLAGDQLDGWLKVRHSVAHGDPRPPDDSNVLACYRSGPRPKYPTIRLDDAKRCVSHIERLVRRTAEGVSDEYGVQDGVWSDP